MRQQRARPFNFHDNSRSRRFCIRRSTAASRAGPEPAMAGLLAPISFRANTGLYEEGGCRGAILSARPKRDLQPGLQDQGKSGTL